MWNIILASHNCVIYFREFVIWIWEIQLMYVKTILLVNMMGFAYQQTLALFASVETASSKANIVKKVCFWTLCIKHHI